MKIQRLDAYEKIVDALEKADAPVMFFTQAQMLHTFFNKEGFEFYCIKSSDSTYFFLRKAKTGELRLLFNLFPENSISFLKKEINPPYIAYNQIVENPQNENQFEEIEVVIDLEKYYNLENKKIRKHYNQAVRANRSLVFKEFKNIPKEDLEIFWKTWAEEVGTSREVFSDNTHHDKRFFELFDDTSFFGVAAYDENKMVAYSIGVHHSEGYCLSAFNKSLRGYTNLGLQVSCEKAKQAWRIGYKKMNIAWINNDFKKQFLSISEQLPLYSFELWRTDTFKTKTPHGYTRGLLR